MLGAVWSHSPKAAWWSVLMCSVANPGSMLLMRNDSSVVITIFQLSSEEPRYLPSGVGLACPAHLLHANHMPGKHGGLVRYVCM